MQFIPLLAVGASIGRQTAVFAVESLKAIRDPTNADAVSTVGELSSLNSLEYMKKCMMADKHGRTILKNKPLVGDDVLEYSRTLPANTFGHRYAAYMDHNHFTPSGRTPVKHVADPTLAYVMTRYRQCHDFLHAATDCGRSVEEELAVKILEWKHTGLPLGVLAVAGGWPHLNSAQRANMRVYIKWASLNAPCSVHGKHQVPMYLNVPWEEMLANDFDEVTAVSGITPLPVYLENLKAKRMPVDYSQKLEALRELYERVQQKEADIPESAYTAAGVKNKARIKDIEKELSATKKKVSLEQKKETDAEIEKEQAQLAEENGMSLEEFKQKVLAKERTVGEGTDLAMRHTAQKKERAQQRELKETRRLADRGDFDLEVDYV